VPLFDLPEPLLISDLESLLLRYQALEKPSPALRRAVNSANDDGDDEDEELEEDGETGMVNTRSSGLRNGGGGYGTGSARGRRGGGEDSDGSDFDL
jgi:hypothetical protein